MTHLTKALLPFSLTEPVDKLARSYLSIAAERPLHKFSTINPLSFIDVCALAALVARGLIWWKKGEFAATSRGVDTHQRFLEAGR